MDVNNKNILIISNEFPPNGGGRGVVAYQYCLSLKNQGYKITLLTSKIKVKEDSLKDINIIEVNAIKKLWFIPYIVRLKKMNLNLYHKIILNDIASSYIAGLSFNKELFSKSIHILHGDEPEQIYHNITISKKIFLFKYFYNKTINSCKKIIAVSNYMKEKFLKETTFKNDKKIEVVYAGLDKNFKNNIKVDCNKVYKYKNKDIILTVSRIEKDKGFLEMHEVFKKLIKKDKDFIWMIIGDGSFKNEFEEVVRKDDMQSKVIFKGKIDRNELPRHYKCADIFWLISKYKESFGLVYLEAQSCGTPAIGLNRYGVKEAIKHNETGFLVENVEDSLEIFLSKRHNELKSKSKNFILNFNQDISKVF
jgi:glycosyltransferase involved in cell wall biosynthesis